MTFLTWHVAPHPTILGQIVAKINKLEERAGMIETNARRYRGVNFQWVDSKNGLMKYGMRTNETPQRP